jgi:hypothetical protein
MAASIPKILLFLVFCFVAEFLLKVLFFSLVFKMAPVLNMVSNFQSDKNISKKLFYRFEMVPQIQDGGFLRNNLFQELSIYLSLFI